LLAEVEDLEGDFAAAGAAAGGGAWVWGLAAGGGVGCVRWGLGGGRGEFGGPTAVDHQGEIFVPDGVAGVEAQDGGQEALALLGEAVAAIGFVGEGLDDEAGGILGTAENGHEWTDAPSDPRQRLLELTRASYAPSKANVRGG
jgi:hypothetical protein